jgi:hypothetical protein
MNKLIEHIVKSFSNAENSISKITEEIIKMDGMTGTKTRHFYNNLLNMEDARYLEIGSWKGSSACSAMCNNKATLVCIDNWSQFGGPKGEFLVNFNNYKGDNNALFIEHDCFTLDTSQLGKFNIYMYDGDHTEDSHYKALAHFYNCLDDLFIFIVDDWNVENIRTSTKKSITDLNLTIKYEKEIFTPGNSPYPWWNGIYVALLLKQ